MSREKIRLCIALCVSFAAVFSVSYIVNAFPSAVYLFFQYPSAKMASLFLSAPLMSDGESLLVILHRSIEVHVVPQCSGVSFFSLLLGMLIWRMTLYVKGFRLCVKILCAVPFAYGAVIFLNGVRISLAVFTGVWARHFLPSYTESAVHQWTGFLIFIPAIVAVYIYFERRTLKP